MENIQILDIRSLRIGDFVSQGDEKCEIVGLGVGKDRIVMRGRNKYRFINISDIHPIPITDELLEKIGFKNKIRASHSLGYRFVSDTGYALIWHIKESDAYLIRTLNNESVMIGEKRISYLHQLQHELYDAGIDIKIELE